MDNQHAAEVDLAYLAGLIDGEGCITIQRTGKERGDGTKSLQPAIFITNTNSELVAEVVRILDRFEIPCLVKTRLQSQGWKNTHWVQVVGLERCLHFLTVVGDYLRAKRGQSELVLRFIASRKSNPFPKGAKYSDSEREMVEGIRQLNERGVRDCTPSTEQSV